MNLQRSATNVARVARTALIAAALTALTGCGPTSSGGFANQGDLAIVIVIVVVLAVIATVIAIGVLAVFAIVKILGYLWRSDESVSAPAPAPRTPPRRPITAASGTVTASRGDVIWAVVQFESGSDDEGRTAKDRPVLVTGRTRSADGAPAYTGHPMTSKVEKYQDRDGYYVLTGEWSGPGSVSCVNTRRTVTIPVTEVRRHGGRPENLGVVPRMITNPYHPQYNAG